MMREPGFWARSAGWEAALLSPFAAIYAAATARRVARPGWRAPVPVICLGNLTAGGAGKTPAAIAVLEALAARGVQAHAVSRGYGGDAGQGAAHRVDIARDAASATGDEPLLLAAFAPVWVAKDRAAGAKAAVAAGAQALVLDDGFQNPALAKDLSIVVVDAARGFGNGRVIPAGPLREPVAAGLARADALLVLGAPEHRALFLEGLRREHAPPARMALLEGEVVPREIGIDWRGERVLAFAGIAHPEKFFATLRGLGAEIVAAHPFPDHAEFAPRALRRLEQEAARLDARMVTTEKDAVRLPPDFRGKAMPLPVTLRLAEPTVLEGLLDRTLT